MMTTIMSKINCTLVNKLTHDLLLLWIHSRVWTVDLTITTFPTRDFSDVDSLECLTVLVLSKCPGTDTMTAEVVRLAAILAWLQFS